MSKLLALVALHLTEIPLEAGVGVAVLSIASIGTVVAPLAILVVVIPSIVLVTSTVIVSTASTPVLSRISATIKLVDRSTKMVFIGYERNSGTKAYRFYDPHTKRLRVSRDVVFEEKLAWNWSATADEAPNRFTVEFPTDDDVGKDVKMTSTTCKHGDQGDHNHHDVDTDDDKDVREDLGNEVAEAVHGDHDHNEAQSDNDYHDDGHGHDDYADDTDTDDPAPSMPPSSRTSKTTQFVSPHSQATMDSSGPRRYKTLKNIYKHAQPVTLEYSGLCLLRVDEPANFVEASKDPSCKHAMDEEMKAIESNGT